LPPCLFLPAGRIGCYRTASPSPKTDRSGRTCHVHPRPAGAAAPAEPDAEAEAGTGTDGTADDTPPADPDTLHAVYSALLTGEAATAAGTVESGLPLTLSDAHRERLRRRGLSDGEIDRRGYRTFPGAAKTREAHAAALAKVFDRGTLLSVPGIAATGDRRAGRGLTLWAPEDLPDGIAVPVRDPAGRVVAIKVRRDNPPVAGGKPAKLWTLSSRANGGPSPGAPIHVPLGWARVGERWTYLHAGGGIGEAGPVAGLCVEPPESLSGYRLPAPPSGRELAEAVRASLRMLEVGPDRLTFPVYAAVWRAVLGPADFGVFAAGATGVFKSELSALAQRHFGAGMDARRLPANWSSTGNALEGLAFAAKDALLVVDDFAPSGTPADVARFHREAERLLRAAGNGSGRQRMRADGSLRPPKPPRCLVLATGEDIPRMQSIRARLLIVEAAKGDIDPGRLARAQADAGAGLYAAAMAGYLRHLAPRIADIRAGLAAEAAALRDAAQTAGHARTPGVAADLAVGLRRFLAFALEIGAVTAEEQADLWRRGWEALTAAAAAQAREQSDADPARQFMRLLSTALAAGECHVAGRGGGQPEDNPGAWGWRLATAGSGLSAREVWQPRGDTVGWLDGTLVYLEPDAADIAVRGLAERQGEAIPVGPQTLRKRLKERGLLAAVDGPRQTLTVRRTVGGSSRDVLALRRESLSTGRTPAPGAAGGPTDPTNPTDPTDPTGDPTTPPPTGEGPDAADVGFVGSAPGGESVSAGDFRADDGGEVRI
jgi:hypothetical protein